MQNTGRRIFDLAVVILDAEEDFFFLLLFSMFYTIDLFFIVSVESSKLKFSSALYFQVLNDKIKKLNCQASRLAEETLHRDSQISSYT